MEEGTRFQQALRERLCARRLPRWEELPDFDLYMDQVLALAGRYLGSGPETGEKALTASMVNNYVKMGVMPPPVKKRYGRMHIAHLLAICVLKSVLSISEIRELIRRELSGEGAAQAYDRFCRLYQEMNAAVAEAVRELPEEPEEEALRGLLLHAALRARAEQSLAQEALLLLPPESGREKK